MDEFPIFKVERRIKWGLACAASAILLNIGPPLLLMKIGIDPQWSIQQGPLGGMGVAILIMAGIVFSGSAGFAAGLARPGIQAVMITLNYLMLVDICMMCVSTLLFSISAGIKIAFVIFVLRRLTRPLVRRLPSGYR